MEYGLTDIQEYYANTGALKKAAETAQARSAGDDERRQPPKRVGVSVVEAYGKDVQPRELEATLRIEYRSKLLNPKWAEAMAKQASVKCSWLLGWRSRCCRPGQGWAGLPEKEGLVGMYYTPIRVMYYLYSY